MSNTNKIKKGAKNVENYIEYCNELSNFIDTRDRNSNRHRNQIDKLEQIKNDIDTVDEMYDFFDKITGTINKYEKKNLKIEEKIKKIEKEIL